MALATRSGSSSIHDRLLNAINGSSESEGGMNVPEMKSHAAKLGIVGYSKMTRSELESALRSAVPISKPSAAVVAARPPGAALTDEQLAQMMETFGLDPTSRLARTMPVPPGTDITELLSKAPLPPTEFLPSSVASRPMTAAEKARIVAMMATSVAPRTVAATAKGRAVLQAYYSDLARRLKGLMRVGDLDYGDYLTVVGKIELGKELSYAQETLFLDILYRHGLVGVRAGTLHLIK